VGWTGKGARVVWYAAITLCTVGLLASSWTYQIWDQYYDELPRTANPATGNVYPLNFHGVALYQTLSQQQRLRDWDFWSTAVFCLGFAVGAVHKWITRRQGNRSP
jgi:hypothetical protein